MNGERVVGALFTAYRLPFTAYRLPFTVYRLPFTAYRLPLTVHRSPFTVHRSPSLFTVFLEPRVPLMYRVIEKQSLYSAPGRRLMLALGDHQQCVGPGHGGQNP